MEPASAPRPVLTRKEIFRAWFPLALSWMFMAADALLFSGFVGHLPDATLALAAWGGIVFAVSLLIEGPVIMLLAASTALSRDWESFRRLRRWTLFLGGGLTLLHALVAFTPLYDFVARVLLDAAPELVEPGRTGLRIMLPWTGMIAWRRFLQGVLIRFDRARLVAVGTAVRVAAVAAVMALGAWGLGLSGIVTGSCAIAAGVTAEALFVSWAAAPILRGPLRRARPDPSHPPLDGRGFLRFYAPLAMTPLLTLLLQPLGAGAMGRMPEEILSLAAWQPVHGMVFLTRSLGFAWNEVVVSRLDRPGAAGALRSFTRLLAAGTTGLLLLLAVTPLAPLWFRGVFGLEAEVAEVAESAMLLAVLMPGYQCLQSWYQGVLVHRRRTRGVTEAVVLYLVVASLGLGLGVWVGSVRGISWALCAFTAGGIAQTLWLRHRARPFLAGS